MEKNVLGKYVENDVMTLGNKYNLNVQVLPSVVLVYSKYHRWMIQRFDHRLLYLFHFHGDKYLHTHHFQHSFEDFKYVFEYIYNHDNYFERKTLKKCLTTV